MVRRSPCLPAIACWAARMLSWSWQTRRWASRIAALRSYRVIGAERYSLPSRPRRSSGMFT